MSEDTFGDRMKEMEQVEAGRKSLPHLPICARIDGKCFSRFTKDMARPYDERMSRSMIETTKFLVDETCAAIGYTQSDEISLVYHGRTHIRNSFFDGKFQKVCSVLASMATAKFNEAISRHFPGIGPAFFDCRVWQVPTQDEAANAILWRELDATKNSISMSARHYYSHKELHGKTGSEMQELLFAKGVNFNNYPSFFKRGTYIRREPVMRMMTEDELAKIPEEFRPTGPVQRHEIVELDMPPFSKVTNRTQVVFDRVAPKVDSV